jgi:hypothetical protein
LPDRRRIGVAATGLSPAVQSASRRCDESRAHVMRAAFHGPRGHPPRTETRQRIGRIGLSGNAASATSWRDTDNCPELDDRTARLWRPRG